MVAFTPIHFRDSSCPWRAEGGCTRDSDILQFLEGECILLKSWGYFEKGNISPLKFKAAVCLIFAVCVSLFLINYELFRSNCDFKHKEQLKKTPVGLNIMGALFLPFSNDVNPLYAYNIHYMQMTYCTNQLMTSCSDLIGQPIAACLTEGLAALPCSRHSPLL